MPKVRNVRPTLQLKINKMQDFLNWAINNRFIYGDIWNKWWEEKGAKDFFKYASERGIEYVKEVKKG